MLRRIALIMLALSTYIAGAAAQGEDVPPTVWLEDQGGLSCTPDVFADDDTLVLNLGPDHGSELAVRREGDVAPYFLIVRAPPAEMVPLMNPEAYANAERLELTSELQGLPWEAGRRSERVFTSPGRYTFYSSEILESEVGGYQCSVVYLGP